MPAAAKSPTARPARIRNAVLKALPRERQAQIVTWIDETSRKAAVAQIQREFSLRVSVDAVSEFYCWWHFTRVLAEGAEFAAQLKRSLREMPALQLSLEELNRAAQVAFELDAIKNKKFNSFILLRKLRQKDQELVLTREKFEYDAAAAALRHAVALREIARDQSKDFQAKLHAARLKLFGCAPE